MNSALWVVQGLLAALPGLFLRFLGVAEVLGAIGLILPGLLRIRPALTPLAARRAGDHHDRCDGAHAGGR